MATAFAVQGRETHVLTWAEVFFLSAKIFFSLCTVVAFCLGEEKKVRILIVFYLNCKYRLSKISINFVADWEIWKKQR